MAYSYGNELWTLRRVARLDRKRFGLKIAPSEVWRLLRGMGWSPQKPQLKARERDEEKIRPWKEERWPELESLAENESRTTMFAGECWFSQKTTGKTMRVPSAPPCSGDEF